MCVCDDDRGGTHKYPGYPEFPLHWHKNIFELSIKIYYALLKDVS